MSRNEKRYTHKRPFLSLEKVGGGVIRLLVRQASETGYIECDSKGVFDMAYPGSPYRRARVKDYGHVASALMSGEPSQHVFLLCDI